MKFTTADGRKLTDAVWSYPQAEGDSAAISGYLCFRHDDLTAEDDRVAAHVTFRGTHRGEFLGFPATGRLVTNSGAELAILAENKIVAARWEFHDQLGLLRLVLADNESRSTATRRPHLPDDGSENMIF